MKPLAGFENPKLENVTEWLNRSFDRNDLPIITTKQQQQQVIQQITLVEPAKKQLAERQSSEESEKYRNGTNDDIIEINLSNSLKDDKKQQQQQCNDGQSIKQQQQQQQVIFLSQPNEKKVESNKKNIYDYTATNSFIEQTRTKNNDNSINRIYLYKDPKDQSESLGMIITARQKISDLKTDLAAIVTSIIPDGLVQRFNLAIKIGDEIMEINGISLRNKTEDQIKQILNNSCEYNNGEIEIVIRKIDKTTKKQQPFTDKNTYEQFDELQSVTSSIGTLDPNRSSPSARSSITSSPVSSDMTGNQNSILGYMRLTTTEIMTPMNRIIEPNIQYNNRPVLKISAPPESDTPDYDENIFLNSNDFSRQRKKYSRSQSSSRKNVDVDDRANKFLTTNKSSIPHRSGSTKVKYSNDIEAQRDSLSSNASMDDMRISPASSQKTAINEDLSHRSFTSINTQATVIKVDLTTAENDSSSNIAKSTNKLSIDGIESKNMLSSTSMSSIASARKYSNESCSAESDNFSKYFPSSKENSRRNSKDSSVKDSVTFSNKPAILNDLANEKKQANVADCGKSKMLKSKLSFKFGKRSTSANNTKANESLEMRKNDREKTIKNPLAPYGEIQVNFFYIKGILTFKTLFFFNSFKLVITKKMNK